jgi:hypothetical protein
VDSTGALLHVGHRPGCRWAREPHHARRTPRPISRKLRPGLHPLLIRSPRPIDPVLPPEHLARHGSPLTHAADKTELAGWGGRAHE